MQTEPVYEFGPFNLYTWQRILLRDGQMTPLKPKSADVLSFLIQNRGRIVTKEEMTKEVWKGIFVDDNALYQHIKEIRKVLDDTPSDHRFVETIPRRGYRFNAAVNEMPEAEEQATARSQTASTHSYAGEREPLVPTAPGSKPMRRSAYPASDPVTGWGKENPRGQNLVPPIPPQGVIGREKELAEIIELLQLDNQSATEVPPIALRGMGGIGKTTLSIAIGRQGNIFTLFPDGVLWTELGPYPDVRNCLNIWGDVLGLDLRPEYDESSCADRLRDALYNRRALLIVDDVWAVAHGGYFQVAGPSCRLIFTTREPPIAHALATPERTLLVGLLSPESAMAMFRKMAPEAVRTDTQAIERLCGSLERLPLGLKLAARLLADEAGVPSRMRRLVDELIEKSSARLSLIQSEGRLGLTEDQPVSLQAIIGMSVSRLLSPDLERFAMLGCLAAEPETWSIEVAAAIWQCPREEAEQTVSHFIQRGLVERQVGRYWMHALLADYAREMEMNHI